MIIVYGNFTQTPRLLTNMLRAAGTQVVFSKWGEGRAALQVEAGRHREETVINWGVKIEADSPIRAKMLNRNAGLDKRRQCELLAEAGVRIPETLGTPGSRVPTIGHFIRKHVQSSGGQGVRVVTAGDCARWDTDTEHIYQRLIEKRAEFRVHIWGDKAICVTRKYKDENSARHDPHIWNNGMGYVQKTVTKIGDLMDESLWFISKSATKALGYDFGAVDIAMGMDGAMYVLEVNSAPSLIEERAKLYVEAIVGGAQIAANARGPNIA